MLAIPEVYAANYKSMASLVSIMVCKKMSHYMSTFMYGGRRICMEYHDKDTNVLSIYVGSNMLVCMCLIPKKLSW